MNLSERAHFGLHTAFFTRIHGSIVYQKLYIYTYIYIYISVFNDLDSRSNYSHDGQLGVN